MKRGDIATRVRGNLRAVRWMDRRDFYVLTNMHAPPVEGNFTNKSGHAIKPRVVEEYNAYMGFVDKSDRMVKQIDGKRNKNLMHTVPDNQRYLKLIETFCNTTKDSSYTCTATLLVLKMQRSVRPVTLTGIFHI
jgi:hypothetical protein